MKLEGIHHITAICSDGQRTIDFYVSMLGLRLVKKTVNQDEPLVYHLFFGDEEGSPGNDLTFFVYPHAAPGRPGAGMVHLVEWRVGGEASLTFWQHRLEGEGVSCDLTDEGLAFSDPDGLRHLLVLDRSQDPPLTAYHPEVPADHALRGFAGVRAYAQDPKPSAAFLNGVLGFAGGPLEFEVRGERRGSTYRFDEAPSLPGRYGAGSVHHVAFACLPEEQAAWRARVAAAGRGPTPIIDRHYFRSVYFREPSGVLFELATIGPGFAVDEPPEELGERLALPPFLEHRRAELEAVLPPLVNPRAVARSAG